MALGDLFAIEYLNNLVPGAITLQQYAFTIVLLLIIAIAVGMIFDTVIPFYTIFGVIMVCFIYFTAKLMD